MAKKLQSVQPRNHVIKNALKGMIPELADSHLRIDFYCECSDEKCLERIALLVDEYDHAHRDPNHIMVKPQHALAKTTVVERYQHYWIIERPNRLR
jgi:redox-regulated HSP33 family molecular chaperone